MFFTILILISFILNIYFLTKLLKNFLNIEDKTFNELQNFLEVSKPDKLFKRYYDTVFKIFNSEHKHIDRQVITIEFNENYNNYHAGKACMSDIINNLNYNFKEYMTKEEEPKLIYKGETWYLKLASKQINLNDIEFNNIAINFHINYIDLKHIAKTVKRTDLDTLTTQFKSILDLDESQYIVYDIYNNKFINEKIKDIKTWADYINFVLVYHYTLSNNEYMDYKLIDTEIINKILTKFNKISRKYNWMFENKTNTIYLYNPNNDKIALPNPDGLVVDGVKIV